jgi:hypothetical protein
VEAVTALETVKFQTKVRGPRAAMPFPALPVAAQPAPTAPEARQAWDRVAEECAAVAGAGDPVRVLNKPWTTIGNTES